MAQLGEGLAVGVDDVVASKCHFKSPPQPDSTKTNLFTVPVPYPFAQGIFQLEKRTNQIVVGKFAALYETAFSKTFEKHCAATMTFSLPSFGTF